MSAVYGDLIVPAIGPIELAAKGYSSNDIRQALEQLDEIAANLNLLEVWKSRQLFGIDGSNVPPGPSRGRVGISLNYACTNGIGFWRDYYLQCKIDDTDLQISNTGRPAQKVMAKKRIEQARAEMAIRIPEIQALQQIFEAAYQQNHIPLKLALDVRGGVTYDFEIAYRRTLAYALAFEASIQASSLEPYNSLIPTLVLGTIIDLREEMPAVTARHAFSVYLNLLSKLNAAAAYRMHKGAFHPDLPGDINQLESKQAFLTERLQIAAQSCSETLTQDGKTAIKALLKEVQLSYDRGSYNISPRPWGRIAPSAVYASEPDS
ncbi:MAG: hypothetical protein QNJ46_10760 [Leptolyngbyaceae cyanobacterium MO_188.B28]|nr:hypothetical protein [Leptolyngbyaceae cyanobacterium MO_188.B28]